MHHDYKNLRIVRLEAENVKRLRAVRITPEGSVVEITGENDQGKTSVLDAIWWLVAGTKGIQPKPIADGQEEAIIRADLGPIRVVRTFKLKPDGKDFTTTVRVENQDGAVFSQPQTILDGLIGNLTFDPLAFTRLDARKQFNALRIFVPGFDFEDNAGQRKRIFDDRTDVNRRAREAAARAATIRVPATIPALVDETALVEALERAGQTNSEIEARKLRRQQVEDRREARLQSAISMRRDVARIREQIARLQEEIDEGEGAIAEAEQEAADIQARLDSADPLPEPVDTTAVRQQIEQAREANRAVEAAQRSKADRERETEAAADYEAEAQALTDQIAALDKAKEDAIAAANMPVDGLTFGDGEILLNGAPFEQASTAQKIRTSVAIAMAGNPPLRVARVMDGSLLGTESWKILTAMAEEQNFQVWVETVNSTRASAILIEDGAVAGQPVPDLLGEAAPKPRAKKPAAEPAAAPTEAEADDEAEFGAPVMRRPVQNSTPSRRTLFGE